MEEVHSDIYGKKERDSNMELLRILSILLIILHHVCVHGQWTDLTVYSQDSFILNCLSIGGKIGVDCFILISGYYLITSEKSNYLKIVKLWLSMLFYSVVISVFFFIRYDYPHDSFTIFQMLTPVLSDTWWFMSAFIILMILSPLLNKFVRSIDKRAYLSMIVILTVIWAIVPTITEMFYQCNHVLWFALLYMVAGFIRLYPKAFGHRPRMHVFILLISLAITCVSMYIISNVNSEDSLIVFLTRDYRIFAVDRSITMALAALSIFLLFMNMKQFSSKPVNILASTTLGVYLIHDSDSTREFIWKTLFKNASVDPSYPNAFATRSRTSWTVGAVSEVSEVSYFSDPSLNVVPFTILERSYVFAEVPEPTVKFLPDSA